MLFVKPEKTTKKQKRITVDRLFEQSAPSFDFFLLLIISTLITTLGLTLDNVAIVIGGMLVAPMLFPMLCLGMGLVVGELKLIERSSLVILRAIILTLIVSFSVAVLMPEKQMLGSLLSHTYPSLAYFLVALFSGVAVAYVITKDNISDVVPGVAISVSLLPPLVAAGIGLSMLDWKLAVNAGEMFGINLLGIVFASMVVFSLMKFFEVKDSVEKNIKAEEKIAKEEKKEEDKANIKKLEKQVREATEAIKEKKEEMGQQ